MKRITDITKLRRGMVLVIKFLDEDGKPDGTEWLEEVKVVNYTKGFYTFNIHLGENWMSGRYPTYFDTKNYQYYVLDKAELIGLMI